WLPYLVNFILYLLFAKVNGKYKPFLKLLFQSGKHPVFFASLPFMTRASNSLTFPEIQLHVRWLQYNKTIVSFVFLNANYCLRLSHKKKWLANASLRAEQPVPRVAQTRHDVAFFIQFFIQRTDVDVDVRMVLLNQFDAFRCGDQTHQFDRF